eukprot:TRINITY_DN5387_c0_g1_i2.p1 TRINITY_DN5387_c0_g1~~TRINITY_DN5387_c0_g1_i2.p1  ORF type:complete len:775 (+),score=179.76 TRINITY_DN5387_c0_g1_i2:166-2325(+)
MDGLSLSFTREETRYLFEGFLAAAPSGFLTKDEARTLFAYLHSDFLFRNIFRVLDKKKDAKIDFQEYITALNTIARGTLDEQLDLTFKLFDLNEDQQVSVEEVKKVVTEVGAFLLNIARGMFQKDEFLTLRESFATKIFGKEEDELPLEVFMQRSMGNKTILNCFGIFDFLFSHIVRGMENELGMKKVFGRNLNEILRSEGGNVPQVVIKTTQYITDILLDTEGIFRITGDYLENKEAIAKIDQGVDVDFSKLEQPHVAPSVLKRFLRDLPEPLFTFVYFNRFKQVATSSDPQKALEELSTLILSLPDSHLTLLNYLITFLQKVDAHKVANLMGFDNLAAVFAPCLMRSKGPIDGSSAFADSEVCRMVVLTVFTKWNEIYQEDTEDNRTVRSMKRVIKSLRSELDTTAKLKQVEFEQLRLIVQARDLEIQRLKKELEIERLRQMSELLRADINKIHLDQPVSPDKSPMHERRPSSSGGRTPSLSTSHSNPALPVVATAPAAAASAVAAAAAMPLPPAPATPTVTLAPPPSIPAPPNSPAPASLGTLAPPPSIPAPPNSPAPPASPLPPSSPAPLRQASSILSTGISPPPSPPPPSDESSGATSGVSLRKSSTGSAPPMINASCLVFGSPGVDETVAVASPTTKGRIRSNSLTHVAPHSSAMSLKALITGSKGKRNSAIFSDKAAEGTGSGDSLSAGSDGVDDCKQHRHHHSTKVKKPTE